jgi:DNA polymerase-3 subunit epsilon
MISFLQSKEKPWRDNTYLSVDVETTGLDLTNDEVISIGAVAIHDGRFKGEGNFYAEITPARSPSAASIAVHGLRSGDLAAAATSESVLPQLVSRLEGKLIIAHAAWVERAFLAEPLKKYGYRYPKEVIDTAALARYLGYASREGGREPSLELLAKQLNLPVYSPHHALGDAMTTAAVFLALVAKLEVKEQREAGGVVTLGTLLKLSHS